MMIAWRGGLLLRLFYWVSLHLVLGCVNRKPQGQPPALPQADRKHFEASEVEAARLYNKDIPPVCEGTFRIATFDVNQFNGLEGSGGKAAESLLATIRAIKPTILVLQNMPFDGKNYDRLEFLQALKRQDGYYHMHEAVGKGRTGSLLTIISKLPFGYRESVDLGGGQTAGLISVEFTDGRSFLGPTFAVHILGLQLSPEDAQMREKQAEKVVREFGPPSKESPGLKHVRAVVLGNFNDPISASSLRKLLNRGLVEAFGALKWPLPPYTGVGGKSTDLLLVSEGLQSEVAGAYVYHSNPPSTSTHLPVILDLTIPRKALPAPPEATNSRTAQWINYAVGVALIAILLGLLIYMYRNRRREQALPTTDEGDDDHRY